MTKFRKYYNESKPNFKSKWDVITWAFTTKEGHKVLIGIAIFWIIVMIINPDVAVKIKDVIKGLLGL